MVLLADNVPIKLPTVYMQLLQSVLVLFIRALNMNPLKPKMYDLFQRLYSKSYRKDTINKSQELFELMISVHFKFSGLQQSMCGVQKKPNLNLIIP